MCFLCTFATSLRIILLKKEVEVKNWANWTLRGSIYTDFRCNFCTSEAVGEELRSPDLKTLLNTNSRLWAWAIYILQVKAQQGYLQAITLKSPTSIIMGTKTYRVNPWATFYILYFFHNLIVILGEEGNGRGGKFSSGSSKNILNSLIISIFSFYGISSNESHIIHKII